MEKKTKIILVMLLLLTMTGCTTYIKGDDGKPVVNEKTGQSIVENILCRPTDEETIKLYEANGYDLSQIPYCVCNNKKETAEEIENEEVSEEAKEEIKEQAENEVKEEVQECEEFSITKGKYDGLWTTIFVKPLAWVILFFGKLTGKFGLGLIITSILIRLVLLPLTKKSTIQMENMKKIQPEMERLEKKYANKDKNDRDAMMAKSQEMMMIYKKNNVSPMSGCLPSLLQLPLFIAFLDAVNRVPAIFEETFLGFHLGTTPRIGIANGNWLYIVLTVLVAITTFFSLAKSQNNAANTDAAKQTKMMMNGLTIMIIVMSIFMNSALNIYWIVSNACTLLQNYLVKRSIK